MPYYLRNRKEPTKIETVYSLKELFECIYDSKTEFTKKQNQSFSELVGSSFWIRVSLLKNKVKDPKDLNILSSYSAEELWKWFGSPNSNPITQNPHIQSTVSHIPHQQSITQLEEHQHRVNPSKKSTHYFVQDGAKKEYGPIGFEKVCIWITERRLNHFSNCRIDTGSTWKPLSEFAEFAESLRTVNSNQNIQQTLKSSIDSTSDVDPCPKHEPYSTLDLFDDKTSTQNFNQPNTVKSEWTSAKKFSLGLLIFLYVVLAPFVIGVFKELLRWENGGSIQGLFIVGIVFILISTAPLIIYKLIGFATACPKCKQSFARIKDSQKQAYSENDYNETKGWATVIRKDSVKDNSGKIIATIERKDKAYGTWVQSSEYWSCNCCGHFWKTNNSFFRE